MEAWSGSKYIKLTMEWDFSNKEVCISKEGYVDKALKQFQHPTPTEHQNSPYPHVPQNYGATEQFALTDDMILP